MSEKISKRFQCKICNKYFSTSGTCNRHERSHTVRYPCRQCHRNFRRKDHLKEHESICGGGNITTTYSGVPVQSGGAQNVQRAINGAVEDRIFYPRKSDKYDLLLFLANVREEVKTHIEHKLGQHAVKWYAITQVKLYREDRNGEIITVEPYFRSVTYTSLTRDGFDEIQLNESFQKLYAGLEKYIREATGWIVHSVLSLQLHTTRYAPLAGSSYINLPSTLKTTGNILNIRNMSDNKCFVWSILAKLHPVDREPDNVDQYRLYENELDKCGIQYPVTVVQIDRFERQNSDISINVFAYEDGEIVPLRIKKRRTRENHINMLLLSSDNTTHYCVIMDLNSFLHRTKSDGHRHYFCDFCLNGFTKKDLLERHLPYCSTNGEQKIVLPKENEDDILTFTDIRHQAPDPFVIYCDLETFNRPIETCMPNPKKSHTTHTRHLDVCSFGYKVVCTDPKYTKQTVIYRGPEASDKFLECLMNEKREIEEILATNFPVHMTPEDQLDFLNATHCGICEDPFTDIVDKVRDHDHLTGKYRQAAHNMCNLLYEQPKFIPVVFHGLQNFDSHIICQSIGKYEKEAGGIKCIPKNFEKYVSFSLGTLRLLDSFQFMSASLEKLVDNLKCSDGGKLFTHFKSEFHDEQIAKLLMRKNPYPYNYISDESKFEEITIPPKEAFYNDITKTNISDSDYEHACHVFNSLAMRNLGDYSDTYLRTDVLLLFDVFEDFRGICYRDYKLDCCNFYSAPGLSFSAMLKMTGVKLQLLSNVDHRQMFEKGIRGGISVVSHRHAVANNPYMQNYDPTQNISYIQYLDANNLYGWAMTQKLPMCDFRFLDERDVREFHIDGVADDGEKGYLIEASLAYPIHLHMDHICMPLAPERRRIDDDELSAFAKQLWTELNGKSKRSKVEKLVTTLSDKDRYVLHYRNLKLYVSLGLEIKAIHRVLEFHQEAYLKPYIDFNTQKRAEAKTEYERWFYKVLVCSLYGKLMEYQKKHKDITLVSSEKKLTKLSAKPTFRSRKNFNDNLVGVECKRTKVTINKPIYAGQAVLDISKCLMYDFFYNYLKSKYGHTCRLLMTDTDSLLYYVETSDIYADMYENAQWFDTSDYPKYHFCHSGVNRKIPGKFKDETHGKPIHKFCGLRAKMYSFIYGEDATEVKRAKEISKATVNRDLEYAKYENVLLRNSQMSSEMDVIRSRSHELYVDKIQKKSLSSFDDKRFLVNNVESLPYGHYHIQLYFVE